LRAQPFAGPKSTAQRGNGRTRRRLNFHLRSSETIFGIARPARFHPSGFLSGADGAYSSLHSQFDTIFSVASIIRKKCGFVNKKMQNRAGKASSARILVRGQHLFP
jgi:hypothetical protein